MIIFDLDGTLADCEHRRHFVDPLHPKNIDNAEMLSYNAYTGELVKAIGWKPDWKAFYEACDQDKPIEPVVIIWHLFEAGFHLNPDNYQIWTGRFESVREKTIEWLQNNLCIYNDSWLETNLKMRPIGDSTPDDELKERWLDEHLARGGKPIEFAFDSDPQSIAMWRRRGVFVFDCNQSGTEF